MHATDAATDAITQQLGSQTESALLAQLRVGDVVGRGGRRAPWRQGGRAGKGGEASGGVVSEGQRAAQQCPVRPCSESPPLPLPPFSPAAPHQAPPAAAPVAPFPTIPPPPPSLPPSLVVLHVAAGSSPCPASPEPPPAARRAVISRGVGFFWSGSSSDCTAPQDPRPRTEDPKSCGVLFASFVIQVVSASELCFASEFRAP